MEEMLATIRQRGLDINEAAIREAASGLKDRYGDFKKKLPVRVVYFDGIFNYSAINNFGVGFAKGGLLLFLNNDVELISPDSLTEMANLALRRETGIVGARLMYGDDTIQHAGVIVGLGGIAGAAFVGLHEKENSYMHRMMCVQDLSAVTAACMMMRREIFDKAGVLDGARVAVHPLAAPGIKGGTAVAGESSVDSHFYTARDEKCLYLLLPELAGVLS